MAKDKKQKDINLILALDSKQRAAKAATKSAIRRPVFALVVVLILMGYGYYYLYTETASAQEDKEIVTYYLKDPATMDEFDKALRSHERASFMLTRRAEVGQTLLNLSSYPDMTAEYFHKIYEYAGGGIEISDVTYRRDTGVLTFTADCNTVTGVPDFVAQLRTCAFFEDVRYAGYTEHSGAYRFTVTALVKASEPRRPGSDQSLIGGPPPEQPDIPLITEEGPGEGEDEDRTADGAQADEEEAGEEAETEPEEE